MSNKQYPHDASHKTLFSSPVAVESLCRDLVGGDFMDDVDFSTLERCSGSYVTDDLRNRYDDIVWRVKRKSSEKANSSDDAKRNNFSSAVDSEQAAQDGIGWSSTLSDAVDNKRGKDVHPISQLPETVDSKLPEQQILQSEEESLGEKGEYVYIYFLLEFQSTVDPWMPVRILCYTALLWQDLIKTKAVKSGEKLPPVLPIVLYDGENGWKAPDSIDALLPQLPDSLKIFQPSQTFFLLDERRCPLKDVVSSLIPCYFKLRRTTDSDQYFDLLFMLSRLVRNAGDPELARFLDAELKNGDYLRMGLSAETIPELITLCEDPMIEDRFERWKEEYRKEGEARGRAEGEARGEARGETKGLMKALANLMAYMNINLDKAMDILRVPQPQRSKLASMMSL